MILNPVSEADPVIDLGCLGMLGVPAAIFLYVGISDPDSWQKVLAFLAVLATVFVAITIYGRLYPFTRVADRFGKQEVDRARRAMLENAATLHLLSSQKFEDAMAALFAQQGFQVLRTPYSNDGGKDIIAKTADMTVFIEVKRYAPGKKVGRPAIMKLHSALNHEKADHGILVTTSSFTRPAVEFAGMHQIRLIDGEKLAWMMREAYPKPDDPTFLRAMCRKCGDIVDFPSLDDDFRTCRRGHSVFHPIGKDVRKPYRPTCPNCKVPMIRSRVDGSRSYIWRCPQCRKLAIS